MSANVAARAITVVALACAAASGFSPTNAAESRQGVVAAAEPESTHEPSPSVAVSPSVEVSPSAEPSPPSVEPSPPGGEGQQFDVTVFKTIDPDGNLEAGFGWVGAGWRFDFDVVGSEIIHESTTIDPHFGAVIFFESAVDATVTVTEIGDPDHELMFASCGFFDDDRFSYVGEWDGASVTFITQPDASSYICDFVNYPLRPPVVDLVISESTDIDGDVATEDRVPAGGSTFQIGVRNGEVTEESVRTDESFGRASFRYATRQPAVFTVTQSPQADRELIDVTCWETTDENTSEVGEWIGRSVTFTALPSFLYGCHFVSTTVEAAATQSASPIASRDIVGVAPTAPPSIGLPQTDLGARLVDRGQDSPGILLVSLALLGMGALLVKVRTGQARP